MDIAVTSNLWLFSYKISALCLKGTSFSQCHSGEKTGGWDVHCPIIKALASLGLLVHSLSALRCTNAFQPTSESVSPVEVLLVSFTLVYEQSRDLHTILS